MKKKSIILLSCLAFLSTGLIATSVIASEKNISIVHAETTIQEYYHSIDINDTGDKLLSKLQFLNNQRLIKRVGYDAMKSKFTLTDPGTSSGQVTSFYSGKSATYSGNMNREHVWPASRTVLGRDNDPLEDDIHMVRPTLISENSSRGNKFFAESGAWDPAEFNNPSYRGDAARIIFYCIVADSQLKLVDTTSDSTSNHTMGKISDMIKWHLQYPIQNREAVRNHYAEQLQGNRNPFIDHPEYVCRIWGRFNSTIYNMCLNDPYEADPVTPDVPSTPSSSGGCGGNIYTTSMVLSTISMIGVGVILIKKFKH